MIWNFLLILYFFLFALTNETDRTDFLGEWKKNDEKEGAFSVVTNSLIGLSVTGEPDTTLIGLKAD